MKRFFQTVRKKRKLPSTTNSTVEKKLKTSPLARNIVAWNVNGFRAAWKKGFLDKLKEVNPAVMCLSEVKAKESEVATNLSDIKSLGYKVFWNSSDTKKGYAGTAILSKVEPTNVTYGLEAGKLDDEGRTITLEFEKFFLVHSYVPNAGSKLDRLDWRVNTWDVAMLKYLQILEKTKPVVWCGDLNVAHKEIDLHNPDTNHKTAGFTDQERESFGNVLDAGFVDVYRHFHPKEHDNCYTYWSYRFNARVRNMGWRIDYFVTSPSLIESKEFTDIKVLSEINKEGKRISDHAPLQLLGTEEK